MIHWTQEGQAQQALWRSESGASAPRRVEVVDDTLSADAAYRMACEGTGLLWQGDFQNARHLLQALMRRVDRKPRKSAAKATQKLASATPAEAFHLHRQAQAQRARVLASVLIPLESDYGIGLRRAPDWRLACTEAWGPATGERTVVASDAGHDPQSLVWSFDGHEPIGAVYGGNQPQIRFFDASHPHAMLMRELANAFPGELARVTSATRDGRTAVVTVIGGWRGKNPQFIEASSRRDCAACLTRRCRGPCARDFSGNRRRGTAAGGRGTWRLHRRSKC